MRRPPSEALKRRLARQQRLFDQFYRTRAKTMPKSLTPTQKQNRATRQAMEATYPKCSCGNTLGLERVTAQIDRCRGCLPDEELSAQQRRFFALRHLEERAVRAKTFDDLSAVVVDLLRRLRHENQP